MKSYTFSEYKQLQEMSTIDKFIGNLKKNKKEYAKLVFILAITIPKSSFAATNDMGLGDVAWEIVHMIMVFGKYGCLRQRNALYVSRNATRGKSKTGIWRRNSILYFLYNT